MNRPHSGKVDGFDCSMTATEKILRKFAFSHDRHDLFKLVAKSIPAKPRSAVQKRLAIMPKA